MKKEISLSYARGVCTCRKFRNVQLRLIHLSTCTLFKKKVNEKKKNVKRGSVHKKIYVFCVYTHTTSNHDYFN